MLNLLSFKPDGGRERDEEYGEAVAPLLEKAGGQIVFMGSPAPALLGEGSWDLVVLVEYPTRQAFLDMIGSSEYEAIGHLRTEALIKGRASPDGSGSRRVVANDAATSALGRKQYGKRLQLVEERRRGGLGPAAQRHLGTAGEGLHEGIRQSRRASAVPRQK